MFNANACDAIFAIGGGSVIDVAKCIKFYSYMDSAGNKADRKSPNTQIPIIAVPTTAGIGSEATRYVVIYNKGKKQSISDASIQPDYVILDPLMLETLPLYQKKCTMLDALCQGIESWWSVNSTDESRGYSQKAVKLIMENWKLILWKVR